MNICGCLVHALRDEEATVASALADMKGVEVHAATGDGRLVVVVEDVGSVRAAETMMAMHQLPGVVSLTLTYHHFEDLPQGGASRPQRVEPCAP